MPLAKTRRSAAARVKDWDPALPAGAHLPPGRFNPGGCFDSASPGTGRTVRPSDDSPRARVVYNRPAPIPRRHCRGSSSVGRALAFQAGCREFESRLPLPSSSVHLSRKRSRADFRDHLPSPGPDDHGTKTFVIGSPIKSSNGLWPSSKVPGRTRPWQAATGRPWRAVALPSRLRAPTAARPSPRPRQLLALDCASCMGAAELRRGHEQHAEQSLNGHEREDVCGRAGQR